MSVRRIGAVAALLLGIGVPLAATPAAASTVPSGIALTTIDPVRGHPTSISCVGSDFCMAVDASGAALHDEDGVWSAPDVLKPAAAPHEIDALDSVSCVSANFCVTVADSSDGYVWDGTTWTRTPLATNTEGLSTGAAVSCVTDTFCMSLADGEAELFDGATWGRPVVADPPNGGRTSSVSCASTTMCVGVDTVGTAVMWDGSNWTTQAGVVAGTNSAASVSCATSTFCVAVGGDQAAVYDGTSWAAPVTITGVHTLLTSVSCAAAGACTAVDNDGDAAELGMGSWTSATTADPTGSVRAISCGTTSACTIVDSYGGATSRGGGAWPAPVFPDADTGDLSAVSCASDTFCAAVDDFGNALRYDGTTWTEPVNVGRDITWRTVSCVSPTFCAATGYRPSGPGYAGVIATYDGTAWTPVAGAPIEEAAALSCPTSSFCRATDYSGDVIAFDGLAWTLESGVLGGSSGPPISCTSATFCTTGRYYWDGTSWTPHDDRGPSPAQHLDCTDASFCAGPDGQSMSTYDGASWRLTDGDYSSEDMISCPSRTFCALALPYSGAVLGYELGRPTADEITTEGDAPTWSGFGAISCPSIDMCMVIDGVHAGRWRTGLGAPPVITAQPIGHSVDVGEPVAFSAEASNTPDAQWQVSSDGVHWADITGATRSSITVYGEGDAYLRVTFTNLSGSTTSVPAQLYVNGTPVVTRQPVSRAARYGSTVSFTAAASGIRPVYTRWQHSTDGGRSWAPFPSGTRPTLTITATRSELVRAVFGNSIGRAGSHAARLTVQRAPVVTSSPSSRTVGRGAVVRLAAAAVGSPAPTDSWQVSSDRGRHWTTLAGRTGPTLTFRVTAAQSGRAYRARFVNRYGTAFTRAATITVR